MDLCLAHTIAEWSTLLKQNIWMKCLHAFGINRHKSKADVSCLCQYIYFFWALGAWQTLIRSGSILVRLWLKKICLTIDEDLFTSIVIKLIWSRRKMHPKYMIVCRGKRKIIPKRLMSYTYKCIWHVYFPSNRLSKWKCSINTHSWRPLKHLAYFVFVKK